jgi:hypothetical protein
MTQRISFILFTAALALGACGGDDGGSLDNPSDAFNESIRTSCQRAFDCMASYDPAMNNDTPFSERYGTSVDDCIVQTNALIEAFLGPGFAGKLDASVAAGRITYNAADAEVCLAASRALTCDQFFGQNGATATSPPECDTTFVGHVATGAACTIDLDCAAEADDCDQTSMTCAP